MTWAVNVLAPFLLTSLLLKSVRRPLVAPFLISTDPPTGECPALAVVPVRVPELRFTAQSLLIAKAWPLVIHALMRET